MNIETVETFEEGCGAHVIFDTIDGHQVEGDVIEKITYRSRGCIAVTLVNNNGNEERYTFLNEASWQRATGQLSLFDNEEGGSEHHTASQRPQVGDTPSL